MPKLGLPALDTIRAAAVNAAELPRKVEDVGSIEKGRFADFIAVPGDPLRDITEARAREVCVERRRGREE